MLQGDNESQSGNDERTGNDKFSHSKRILTSFIKLLDYELFLIILILTIISRVLVFLSDNADLRMPTDSPAHQHLQVLF